MIVPAGQTTYSFNVTTGSSDGNDHNVQVTAYTGPKTGVYSQVQGTCFVGLVPAVRISSPSSGATVGLGTLPVTATARSTGSGGTISTVSIYEAPAVTGGGYGTPILIGTVTTPASGTLN